MELQDNIIMSRQQYSSVIKIDALPTVDIECIFTSQSLKMYILYLAPDARVRSVYEDAANAYNAKAYQDRDAGFDLFSVETDVVEGQTTKVSQQTVAGFYDTSREVFRAYWMLPRSSISKTPLRLANSVGLIDAGYRGTILAMVDHNGNPPSSHPFHIVDGSRYFQLASPDLLPWDRVEIVDTIPGGATLRGSGGFGSTGLH